MNAKERRLACVCLALCLFGCDSGVSEGGGKVESYSTVCNKENEGKRVTLEGFLDFPSRFNAKAPTIVMRLQAAPTLTSAAIGARVKLNAGTNSVVAPPDKYNKNDLKVTTHDGKSADHKTRLKLIGTMSYTDSLDTRQFACFLDSVRIEIAGAAAAK